MTTKPQALVAEHSEPRVAPKEMQVFRHPTISPGTRLGHVGAHPFGLSDWMRRRMMSGGQRKMMTTEELKTRNTKGASLSDLNIKEQAAPSTFTPEHVTGMTLRDAKRRRWHAEKAIDHMTHDMEVVGANTWQAHQMLREYADAHSVLADGGTRFMQITMPMTGGSAEWRDMLKRDSVANSIPNRSIKAVATGNGNILEHGAVATVKDPDGSFHMIRHLPSHSFEHARFMRGIPPGYAGFIPHEVRQLSAPTRAPRYVQDVREVTWKEARQLAPTRAPPPPAARPMKEGWSAACASRTAVRV